MNLRQKLLVCEKYIKETGYEDASIVRTGDGSEMIIFKIKNITAKYPNERPSISVAFANGTMNDGEIDFDIMQIMCFVSTGVPEDRLTDIQKFCSDFNKAMQIGHFGVDYKNQSVYFKCAQVVDKNVEQEYLVRVFDNIFTMIIFYFGYSYEILLELAYGIIGYGSTSRRMRERRRVIEEAMAELKEDEEPAVTPTTDNPVLQELLAQLSRENPEILAAADIDVNKIRKRTKRTTKKQASAEEAAQKILSLAQEKAENKPSVSRPARTVVPERDAELEVTERKTVRDDDTFPLKNQMPSVEMFAQREKKNPEPGIDMESLKRALIAEQKEREKRMAAELEVREAWEAREAHFAEAEASAEDEEAPAPKKKQSSESLVQRLRKWTQN